MKITNLDSIDKKFVDATAAMKTIMMGLAGGSERLYANIDIVQPGARSCKLHSHSHQEEFFLVLKGSGVLRIGGQARRVEKGDFFCKPAGKGIAHQFFNDGNEPLEILDVGTLHAEDVIEYPEEKVRLHRAQRTVVDFDGNVVLNWTSDPN